jgi:hypothetical protein
MQIEKMITFPPADMRALNVIDPIPVEPPDACSLAIEKRLSNPLNPGRDLTRFREYWFHHNRAPI